MMTRRRTTTALIAGLFALSAIGAAVADEHEEDPAEESTETVVETVWSDETRVLIVTLDDDGDEEGPCDDVTAERDDEGNIVVSVGGEEIGDENPLPDGCLIFDGEGKDGKVNHGTIVSSVAKNLSPHDLDIPKGHVMREVAKLKKGEDFTQLKADDEGAEEEAEAKAEGDDKPKGNDKPKNGKAKGHSK